MDTSVLKEEFATIFGEKSTSLYFAPGRINLIGEHTDYNGGHVFPCAITLGTYGVVRPRNDRTFRLYSKNLSELGLIEFSLDDLSYQKAHNWTNYPKGMAHFLEKQNFEFSHGLDIYFYGNIPNGAGLSSSASIELLMGVILKNEFNLNVSQLDLVKTGKQVENEFIGVNSGIMDQFAIGMGKAEMALFLDTNTLDYELVPVKLGDYVVVIMNTNKRRELADSKYNERRGECETALAHFQTKLPIQSLGELDDQAFDEYSYLLGDATLIKRARHAVFENQRTILAKAALIENDLEKFGHLINASHVSLQYDYEVTGIELDTLVSAALTQEHVLGARMTGAGFGGCAIALVHRDTVDAFKENVGRLYAEKIGYPADFYVAEVANGAGKLE